MTNKKPLTRFANSLMLPALVATSACDSGNRDIPLADGLNDFNKVVDMSYKDLVTGGVKKKIGFNTKCSVDFKTIHGIRVSETVCDDNQNVLDVTIRITDPTSRPPSQQQKAIHVSDNTGNKFTVDRGDTKTLVEGITLNFDRSGQSAVINGKVDAKS